MKRKLIVLVATVILVGCGNEMDLTMNLSADDQVVVAKAYSKTYLYPAGFEYESNLDGSPYYENTVSIGTSTDSWLELYTNSKVQAREWSEISNSNQTYTRLLTEERETEKYFEFKRVSPINPSDVILSRVHKSTYFIPSYDKFKRGITIGVLMVPVTKESVKTFVEYIWTCNLVSFPIQVLENTIIDDGNIFRYNIKSVNVIYGDWGICDVIEVKNYDFLIEKGTGVITFESNKVKEIQGTCR